MTDQNLSWIRRHMPLTRAQCDALPRLDGVRLACSIHLEPKVVLALEAILQHGAAVFLTTCNPATVRDEVVEWLAARGAVCPAWKGMSAGGHGRGRAAGARLGADPPVRDGCEPFRRRDCRAGPTSRWRREWNPPARGFPGWRSWQRPGGCRVFRSSTATMCPSRKGCTTGTLSAQSAWQAFTQCTQLSLHRKNVLVVGYGPVGQGVALTARALGGTVRVAEKDPGPGPGRTL